MAPIKILASAKAEGEKGLAGKAGESRKTSANKINLENFIRIDTRLINQIPLYPSRLSLLNTTHHTKTLCPSCHLSSVPLLSGFNFGGVMKFLNFLFLGL